MENMIHHPRRKLLIIIKIEVFKRQHQNRQPHNHNVNYLTTQLAVLLIIIFFGGLSIQQQILVIVVFVIAIVVLIQPTVIVAVKLVKEGNIVHILMVFQQNIMNVVVNHPHRPINVGPVKMEVMVKQYIYINKIIYLTGRNMIIS
jgi:hypothetical protein